MRAKEFTDDYTEYPIEEFQGVPLKLIVDPWQVTVTAYDDWNEKIAHAYLSVGDGNELDPRDLMVYDRARGQGIAKAMYDYLKHKGYKVVKSPDVTKIKDQGTQSGEHFWKKNRGDKTVWEDQ